MENGHENDDVVFGDASFLHTGSVRYCLSVKGDGAQKEFIPFGKENTK